MLANSEQPTLLPVPQVEQEPTEVGGSLSLVVPCGSGALFAGTRRVEQRASTAALDPSVPLRLEKAEPHGYHRGIAAADRL